MSKRSRRVGPEGLVDHVDRSQKKKAEQVWILVGLVVGLLTTVVASDYVHPVLAAFLGALVGLVVGGLAALWVYVWPVVRVIWWWLPETMAVGSLLAGWNELAHHATLPVRFLVVAVVVGVPAVVPPLRHAMLNVAWCFIARHRVRVCFTQFIITNRYDTDPFILWARPTKAGVRVWVWLRAGISVEDLQSQTERMASTCWVNEVAIERDSETNAAYIYLDLKRRNAFAEPNTAPIVDGIDPSSTPELGTAATAEVPKKLNLGDVTDADATPDQPTEQPAARPSRRHPRPATAPAATPAAVSTGGEDISEYL